VTWSAGDLDALRAGEAWAIDRMYRENAHRVLGWVIRLGGPALDAEDVAHDVFAVALRKVGAFRGDSQLSTWLFGVTRGVVANARRRAAFRRFLGLDSVPEPRSEQPRPDDIAEQAERRRQVQEALEALSAAHREVVVLCDLEDRTAPEVAEMLGVAVGTVYSRLHHGRKRFREALDLGDLPELTVVSGGGR
jgi:RNA polymerase sigma-70 factor (ECF subfamily)